MKQFAVEFPQVLGLGAQQTRLSFGYTKDLTYSYKVRLTAELVSIAKQLHIEYDIN